MSKSEKAHLLPWQDLEIFWWARQDLNLGPTDYESAALTAELRAPPLLLKILQEKDFVQRFSLSQPARWPSECLATVLEHTNGLRSKKGIACAMDG
jgi:hypothetical protein